MMIFLQHSQQLKSLAFYNKKNIANAVRLQAVLLQQHQTQAADILKAEDFLEKNRPLLEKMHSKDLAGIVVVYGMSEQDKKDLL